MIEYLESFDTLLNDFLLNLGVMAPILSSILIILEGTLAFLPLFVFITINILTLGPILGVVSSWILTTLGSMICFLIFRKGIAAWFYKRNKKKGKKYKKVISKLPFAKVVMLIAIPFMPSFFFNMGAGFSKIPIKKFFYALLIGKLFVVIFWGYVGKNLVECFTNPRVLLKVLILVSVSYLIAAFINKKYNLDGRF